MTTVTLGFAGGLTLTRCLGADAVQGLRDALEKPEAAWHTLKTDRGTVVVALPRLAYFELDGEGRRPGFG